MNLDRFYLNPDSPAYLAGSSVLYRVAKEKLPSLKLKQVKHYLTTKDVYTLHRPIRHRFPRNRVLATGLDSDWQADLIDLKALKRWNSGHAYVLLCIDVLSKFLFAVPVKNKKPATVLQAFKLILRSGRSPFFLCTDSGNEFKSVFHKSMEEQGIHHHFATSPDVKASVAERAIRTVKGKLWRHFTLHKTFTYLDVLPKIIAGLNATVHTATGYRPIDVTFENEERVKSALFGTALPPEPKFKFKVGDLVRISKERKRVGVKGYLPGYTQEVFKVRSRLHNRTPASYRIADQSDESIVGVFYEPELSRVARPTRVYKKRSNR